MSISNLIVTPSITSLTTKGDILTHDGTSLSRFAVGANGSVLSAQSTATVGLSWRTTALAATGVYTYIGSSVITSDTATVSFNAASYDMIIVHGIARSSANTNELEVKLENSALKLSQHIHVTPATSGGSATIGYVGSTTTANHFKIMGSASSASTSTMFGFFTLQIALSTMGDTHYDGAGITSGNRVKFSVGGCRGAISKTTSPQIEIYHTSGSFVSGSKFYVYGLNQS
jgi:hypothetical protein